MEGRRDWHRVGLFAQRRYGSGLRPINGGNAAETAYGFLPTPQVGNTMLQNLVNNLFKGTTNPNRVGNGTTMYAIGTAA